MFLYHRNTNTPGDSAASMEPVMTPAGWRASLELRYQKSGNKTCLVHQRHHGPLRVQKPFYPEGDAVCHTCIIHPPGGIAGGDTLDITIRLADGAHALATTPAAGKFYRTAGDPAFQTIEIDVAGGAFFEWMPQETIVYNGANARIATRINLAEQAGFLGWEILCLGLPASKSPFASGRIFQDFQILRNGRPLIIEAGLYEGDSPVLNEPWGMGGRPVCGTLFCTTDREDLVDGIRKAVEPLDGNGLFAVTLLDGAIICRFLGHDAYVAMEYFITAWEVLRPAVIGKAPCPPRIWKT